MGNGIFKYLDIVKESLLSIIYVEDDKCVICKSYIGEGYLCSKCEKRIKLCHGANSMHLNYMDFKYYSATYYSGNVMELIVRLKYKSDFVCGEILSGYMIDKIKQERIPCDFLTYVPMRKKALKKRGYNQSKCLAVNIGKKLDIPVVSVLKKVKDTKDQIGLNRNERWNNIKDSFKVTNEKKIKNKKIILVDDVITTGATAFSCYKELLRAGAEEINILTAAKSNV